MIKEAVQLCNLLLARWAESCIAVFADLFIPFYAHTLRISLN